MTQAGGSIGVKDVSSGFYDVFQAPEGDRYGDWTKFVSVLPVNKGSNVDGYNENGQAFTFNIPDGTYDTMGSYFTVDASIYQASR